MVKETEMTQSEKIIQKLQLEPHPEGGFFKETYRSKGAINQDNLGDNYQGRRNYSTCIYFLLKSDKFSAFHKIHQDEIWHYYQGSSVRIHMISKDGSYSNVVVGCDFDQDELPQFVVPGNTYFAAEVVNQNDFTLVGCTVSPGFDFKDFELSKREELLEQFPQHSEVISNFTRV